MRRKNEKTQKDFDLFTGNGALQRHLYGAGFGRCAGAGWNKSYFNYGQRYLCKRGNNFSCFKCRKHE
ncbi:hypothetical protein DXD02_05635 [Blautia sp. TF10-30]|nr:hypothetical protein DXD26_13915 [Blautia sp. TF12-31AT]RHU39278.1 hypothetical protein DXD21_03580 [Blautia sp. TF12-12AT]RHU58782.1 hypothetical protein DXD02_05635 [Blautia sp. TF10-30]